MTIKQFKDNVSVLHNVILNITNSMNMIEFQVGNDSTKSNKIKRALPNSNQPLKFIVFSKMSFNDESLITKYTISVRNK